MWNPFNKEKNTELVVSDKIVNTRKIDVADLKQYFVDGYNEIRTVKKEKEDIEKELEKEKEYKHLYQSTLVVLEEYKKREEENKNKIAELKEKYQNEQEKNYSLQDQINSCTIAMETAENKIQQADKIIDEKVNEKIEKIKENICYRIQIRKGNLSKSEVCKIIKED